MTQEKIKIVDYSNYARTEFELLKKEAQKILDHPDVSEKLKNNVMDFMKRTDRLQKGVDDIEKRTNELARASK